VTSMGTGFSDISRRTALALLPSMAGFGLLNYQGIRKPAYYAFRFLNRLGSQELLPTMRLRG